MHVMIIGGSGHVGSYTVPILVERGHKTIKISHEQRQPCLRHAAWKTVGHDYRDVSPYNGQLTCSKRAGLTLVEYHNGDRLESRPLL